MQEFQEVLQSELVGKSIAVFRHKQRKVVLVKPEDKEELIKEDGFEWIKIKDLSMFITSSIHSIKVIIKDDFGFVHIFYFIYNSEKRISDYFCIKEAE